MTSALLLAGALAGYILLMVSNPVRASLRDGLRAVQRYPRLWMTLGLFGFGYALFQLGLRLYFFWRVPSAHEPLFYTARATFRPTWEYVVGRPDSLWYAPAGLVAEQMRVSLIPMLDSLGGLFNNLVVTFPLAAVAALLLLVNWRGHQRVLLRALTKRFGWRGGLLHLAILLAALAALAKPLLYALPQYVNGQLWLQWSPVLAAVAFWFEYLFGVGLQIYLLLIAYCWVRGLTFEKQHLLDFTIRRFSYVVRWALVVLSLSTVLVDLPLILKNFAPFAPWLDADAATLDWRNVIARVVLNAVFLAFATVQITLTFHNESLRRSLRDHWHFLRRHLGPLVWFILLAGLHFFALHLLHTVSNAALGEGSALWVAWQLLFPWVNGFVGAWLLAAWVSFFRRADRGRLADKDWVKY